MISGGNSAKSRRFSVGNITRFAPASIAMRSLSPSPSTLLNTPWMDKAWDASEGDEAFAVEFGLEREFILPLATGKIDPFVGLVGALAELQPGELGLFQVLWQPVQNPWAESIVNSVTLPDGKPLFVNAPELAGAAENKAARPLYAAVVRILVRTATTSRLQGIARELAGSLRVFINPQGNALISRFRSTNAVFCRCTIFEFAATSVRMKILPLL